MNNNTQESKIQLEYINKCTELVKEKYKKAPAFFIQNAGCQMNSLQTDTVAGIVNVFDGRLSLQPADLEL